MKRLASGKPTGLTARTPTFSAEVEAALANNVQDILNQGANLKADEVLDLITEYLHKNNISAVFTEGRPGKDWLRSFLARNKLSLKKAPKEGQVVMTICKGCQELGPPPLAIPPGKKWARAWALIDDPSYQPSNHCMPNGHFPMKKDSDNYIVGERFITPKDNQNHFVPNGERYSPIKLDQNVFVVDEGSSSPSKNEHTQYSVKEGRTSPLKNGQKRFIVEESRSSPPKSDHVFIVGNGMSSPKDEKDNYVDKINGPQITKSNAELNVDVEMNPTVYILNNADNIHQEDSEMSKENHILVENVSISDNINPKFTESISTVDPIH